MTKVEYIPNDPLSAEFQHWLLNRAGTFQGSSISDLLRLEGELTNNSGATTDDGLAERAAIKLALARAYVRALPSDTRFSVVVPMYGENIRLKPRGSQPGQEPHGEDALRWKIKQMEWLLEGSTLPYHIFFVDDMSKSDPVTSGEAAQAIIDEEGYTHASVIFLHKAVENQAQMPGIVQAALRGVEIPKNSKKAGAVLYGMAHAIQECGDSRNHLIAYTDTDLSVHIAQIGTMAGALNESEKAELAAASRRLPTSVLKLGQSRNLRANLARYFRQLLLGDLLPKDTQCGLKLFRASALKSILLDEPIQHLDLSFDVELLTRTAVRFNAESIVPVAIAAFDSAEMTTTDNTVHWNIHRTGNDLGRWLKRDKYLPQPVRDLSTHLAGSVDDWNRLLDLLPHHPDLVAGLESFDPSVAGPIHSLIR
jgi:hypothetical protein